VIQEEPDTGPPWVGVDAVIDHLRLFARSFPDGSSAPRLTLVGDRQVASISVIRGTNSGPFPGRPDPTNKPIAISMAHVVALDESGRIDREWIVYDHLTMLAQLELVPFAARARVPADQRGGEVVVASGAAPEAANLAAYRAADDAFNRHDAAGFAAGLADELTWFDASQPQDLGKADALAAAQTLWRGFSDLNRAVTSAWAAGDYVVATGTLRGTNDGPVSLFGIEASGKAVAVSYVEVAHFTGGKRDRSWIHYNGIAVAQQLGLLGG
jgi:predicted ester cyclase